MRVLEKHRPRIKTNDEKKIEGHRSNLCEVGGSRNDINNSSRFNILISHLIVSSFLNLDMFR